MKKLHETYGDLKYEKGFKTGVFVCMAYVALILLIVAIFANPCHAQDKKDTTFLGLKVTPVDKWDQSSSEITEHSLHDKNGWKIAYKKKDSLPVIIDWEKFFYLVEKEPDIKLWVDTCIGKFDLIPITLLVRIQGRPWAFFHDGWEVRKVDSVAYMGFYECSMVGCLVAHPPVQKYRMESPHLLYLDSRKRPIRKEWVVYQTFKR